MKESFRKLTQAEFALKIANSVLPKEGFETAGNTEDECWSKVENLSEGVAFPTLETHERLFTVTETEQGMLLSVYFFLKPDNDVVQSGT